MADATVSAIVDALLGSLSIVASDIIKNAEATLLKPTTGRLEDLLLSGYTATKRNEAINKAIADTEGAYRQSSKVTRLQADIVLSRMNTIVHNEQLQKQTLETLLLMDEDDPALVSDAFLAAISLTPALRPALATFLFCFRLHFAQIEPFRSFVTLADEQQVRSLLSRILKIETHQTDQNGEIVSSLRALLSLHGLSNESSEGEALSRYIKFVENKHNQLSFLFVRPRTREAATGAELDAVFVPLTVDDLAYRRKPSSRKMLDTRHRQLTDLGPESEGEEQDGRLMSYDPDRIINRTHRGPRTIAEMLPEYPCMLLKGSPGCGKTTLLRHLALTFARGEALQKLDWKASPLLPIYLPLRNFGRFLTDHRKDYTNPAPLSLLAFIEDFFREHVIDLTADFFRRRLDNGGCLVLLDALDEVSDPSLRANLAQHVTGFIDRYLGLGNQFIISSRPKGYDEVARYLPHPVVCTVQPLTSESRAQLIGNMFHALDHDPEQADRDSQELLDEIIRKDKVDELSRNPLFCSVVVLVSKYRGTTLPERRVDVYQEIVDLLLGFWDTQRLDVAEADQLAKDDGTGRSFRDVRQAVEAKRRALMHMAYWMQTEGLADTSEAAAITQLASYFRHREGAASNRASTWASGFLATAHQRSGLFVESAPGVYNFSHQNFREYLAATALVGELDANLKRLVLEHIDDAWWEEVILLAMALPDPVLSDPRRKMLIEEMIERDHVFSAVKCALDMGDRLAEPMRQYIIEALKKTMWALSKAATIRVQAANALMTIGWKPGDLVTWQRIPTGEITVGDEIVRIPEYLVARYPVTIAQFRCFIDAGGYANERYWLNQFGFDETGSRVEMGTEGWDWLKRAGGTRRRPVSWENSPKNEEIYPVTGVTWYEATAYCNWLTEALHTGEVPIPIDETLGYVALLGLPSKLEWVRAAGGDDNDRFPWDDRDQTATNAEERGKVLEHANISGNGLEQVTPVFMYPDGVSKPFGIWDMAGNVCEWTSTIIRSQKCAYTKGGGHSSMDEDLRVRACHIRPLDSDVFRFSGLRVCARSRSDDS